MTRISLLMFPDDPSEVARLERLLAMLRQLSGVQGATAKALAAEHGVSIRTIQRDLVFLRESAFPIENLGRGLGHRLSPQFRLPPQALNTQDILPMVLGGQLFGQAGQRAALTKLRNYVVNGVEKLITFELEGRVSQPEHPAQGLEWLEPVSLAIVQKRAAKLLYANPDECPRWRWVDPHTLFLRNSIWYVDAYDHEKRATRTFRLNRIQKLEVLRQGQLGEYQPTQGFHPWDFGNEEPIEARVHLSSKLRAWLVENPPHPSQRWDGDDVLYTIRERDVFARWVLGLDGATLKGPPCLIRALLDRIRKISTEHGVAR